MTGKRSTSRPLLLLDVDGVLAPLGPGPAGEDLVSFTADGHHVAFARATPARLARLTRHFRLVWATSWQDGANEHLAPALGLPTLPVVRLSPDDEFEPGTSWKLAAVRAFVRGRPFAWLDDELGFDVHQWAANRDAPTLPVDVRPDVGMTEEHVEALVRFAIDG